MLGDVGMLIGPETDIPQLLVDVALQVEAAAPLGAWAGVDTVTETETACVGRDHEVETTGTDMEGNLFL